jgi:hypothetical protein
MPAPTACDVCIVCSAWYVCNVCNVCDVRRGQGVELDPNELWAVDVTAPDIETKSYMRNTLASENRCAR